MLGGIIVVTQGRRTTQLAMLQKIRVSYIPLQRAQEARQGILSSWWSRFGVAACVSDEMQDSWHPSLQLLCLEVCLLASSSEQPRIQITTPKTVVFVDNWLLI